jgi:predicted enzyme related to lactoylglutathione lyase
VSGFGRTDIHTSRKDLHDGHDERRARISVVSSGSSQGSICADSVAGVARLGILRDREGARFGLWQSAPLDGAMLTDVEGSLWWAEVLSDTPPVARDFYSSLFGWSTRETTFEP